MTKLTRLLTGGNLLNHRKESACSGASSAPAESSFRSPKSKPSLANKHNELANKSSTALLRSQVIELIGDRCQQSHVSLNASLSDWLFAWSAWADYRQVIASVLPAEAVETVAYLQAKRTPEVWPVIGLQHVLEGERRYLNEVAATRISLSRRQRLLHKRFNVGLHRTYGGHLKRCQLNGTGASLGDWLRTWTDIGVLHRLRDALACEPTIFAAVRRSLQDDADIQSQALLFDVEVLVPAASGSKQNNPNYEASAIVVMSEQAWLYPLPTSAAQRALDSRAIALGSKGRPSLLLPSDPVLINILTNLQLLRRVKTVCAGGLRLTLKSSPSVIERSAYAGHDASAPHSVLVVSYHQGKPVLTSRMPRNAVHQSFVVEGALAHLRAYRAIAGMSFRSPKWDAEGVTSVEAESPAGKYAGLDGERFRISVGQMLEGLAYVLGIEVGVGYPLVLTGDRSTMRLLRQLYMVLKKHGINYESLQAIALRALVEVLAGATRGLVDRYHLIQVNGLTYEIGVLPFVGLEVPHRSNVEIDPEMKNRLLVDGRLRALLAKTLFMPPMNLDALVTKAIEGIERASVHAEPFKE